VKTDKAAAGTTLNTCVHLCRAFAVLGSPFIPFAARQLFANLALDGSAEATPWTTIEDWACLTGHKVSPKPAPLFTKIEDAQVTQLQARFAGAQTKS